MALPGSIEARWHQLAGGPDRRNELYQARRRLRFTIDEWLALPWWQRRIYVEGMNNEAREQEQANSPAPTGASGIDAIYSGNIADLRAAGFGT